MHANDAIFVKVQVTDRTNFAFLQMKIQISHWNIAQNTSNYVEELQ